MNEPAAIAIDPAQPLPDAPLREATRKLMRNPAVFIGSIVLLLLAAISTLAPMLGTVDPTMLDPANRDLLPGTRSDVTTLTGETFAHTFWMGSDSYGRDIYSRVLYGGRVSLIVGVSVALLSLLIGVTIGLASGYIRWLDAVVMRIMDGLMSIPGILLAIALVAMWHASLLTVILAITIPEIPRVVRLVRSLVLTIREEPYVEAARSVGTPTFAMLHRHILPNTLAPLIVQGTYICALAILVEAGLSFLGVGLPTDIPTWGNIMAEGRLQFQQFPHNVLFPGAFLAVTVLAVNMLGDGLRDTLDPRFSERGMRR